MRNKSPNRQKADREFEERAGEVGHHSFLKDSMKYAAELGLGLDLEHPSPCITQGGVTITDKKTKVALKETVEKQNTQAVREERWQGKLHTSRWEGESLSKAGCFAWLKDWTLCPSNTVAGVIELYEQLLPTRIYYSHKVRARPATEVARRLCSRSAETVQHILAGCPTLAQNKYLERHNNALKILFFEILKDANLIDKVPPWFSQVKPKPAYENDQFQAYWDVPLYAEHAEVRANRIDARFMDHQQEKVIALEMSCPWIGNRTSKEEEKTAKYAPLRWEIKRQYPGYDVQQYNIIIDVLGGWSTDTEEGMRNLLGSRVRTKGVLLKMQKSVLSSSLNIARTLRAI